MLSLGSLDALHYSSDSGTCTWKCKLGNLQEQKSSSRSGPRWLSVGMKSLPKHRHWEHHRKQCEQFCCVQTLVCTYILNKKEF